MGKSFFFKYFVISYAFLIPLGNAIQNIGVVLFAILWLMDIIKKGQISKKQIGIFITFVLYFLIVLATSIYFSNNLGKDLYKLYGLSPLFLFPMFFFLNKTFKINRRTIIRSITSFSISLTLVIALNFSDVLLENGFNLSEIIKLPNKRFALGVVNYHYLYLGYYLSASILLLLYIQIYCIIDKKTNIFLSVMVTVQFGYLFLVGSRTSLVTVILLGTIFYTKWLYKTKNKKGILLFLSMFFLFSISAYQFQLPIIEKVKEGINYKGQYTDLKKVWGGKMMRQEIWYCNTQLFKDKPFLGYGLGKVQEELNQCLEHTSKRPILYLGSYKFNAHNQYFQIVLAAGLLGLISFLGFLTITIVASLRYHNYFYVIFICISAITFITESILQRNKGITIFAFFSCLFYLQTINKKRNS